MVFLIFTIDFLLGVVGLAPLASYSFATAQKSNQKKPSLRLAPRKKHGVPIET